MVKVKGAILLILFSILFTACEALTGKEIGRLKINKVSNENVLFTKEKSFQFVEGEEIAFWSDLDIEYTGDVQLRFKIQMLKDGQELSVLEVNPFDKKITIGEVKTSINEDTKWSFIGKNKSLVVKESGNYTFKGLLITSENPTLKINKAEIVIKK
ncbi:hypothetical protein [Marinigracilibium pacificum]|uniref:Lipoprotein n=1 Tax=Marinigracilibium pacificum TaxID=2729599 RepID=A0A848J360_9BACT|nr:hypothetical protein [Marinigracilibium pacificum]NMM49768.1 hypothetical protein [Marinigracilibium pacificum]